jgi:Mg2+/Co2+ transporter CorB
LTWGGRSLTRIFGGEKFKLVERTSGSDEFHSLVKSYRKKGYRVRTENSTFGLYIYIRK